MFYSSGPVQKIPVAILGIGAVKITGQLMG
jgi:hypothetical protein